MLNRINNNVRKSGGKLLWFDPNLTKDVPIDLSELTLSVDLEVTSKSRSIINSTTVVNTGNQTSKTLSFFDGSLNQGKNKDKFSRTLTTNYTNIQHLHDDLGENYEALGIESINITFNTSYAPTVKIKFIDIRGAAMFSNGGQNDYKFFFELPYPLFNLKIKGYYGKTVSYCLHLLRFNASFNSQTGNFEIDCDFIGFTYALLADMLMGLVRASVTTTRGKKIFNKIKSEYKNKDSIVTIDELVKKIADVQASVTKIKQGEDGKKIAASTKLKELIEELRLKVKVFIDNYAIGLTRFTPSSNDGILICTVPSTSQQGVIGTLYAKYVDEIKEIINNQIKKTASGGLIDFTLTDDDTKVLKESLKPDPEKCGNFTGISRLDSLDVSTIPDTANLRLTLTNAGFSSDKIDYLVPYLQKINFNNTTQVRVIDLSAAIKACDNATVAADNLSTAAIQNATDSLKGNIKDALGFDPTIRNLFRVLCISTEVFLECMLEVSKDADGDSGGRRAAALKPLSTGLNTPQGATKVFPWPEYRKKDLQDGGEYEEWMGNEIPTTNVPELLFTEELLQQMILQFKEDKIMQNNTNGGIGWWPISVIDTTIDNGLTAKMTTNPYTVGLTDELPGVADPKCTGDEALRVLMYRIFLLHSVANYNEISSNLNITHAKLEAENLYNALKNMANADKAKEVKAAIVGINPTDIYTKFLNGTDLNVEAKGKKPFFQDNGNGYLQYTYIVHTLYNSYRSYIPVNGGFDGQLFKTSTDGTLKTSSEIFNIRKDNTALFVGNHTNHTRIVAGSNGFSDGNIQNNAGAFVNIDDLTGINPSTKRWNRLTNDGAVNLKIISSNSYDNSRIPSHDFGGEIVSSLPQANNIVHNVVTKAIEDLSFNKHYQNPITYGRFNVNTYDKIDYSTGANFSEYSSDNIPGAIGSSFIAFFNESVSNTKKNRQGSPIKIYTLAELAYNGFATSHNVGNRFYGWHDYNDRGDAKKNNGVNTNGLFRADNRINKTANQFFQADYSEKNPYEDYGKNRQVIATALQNNQIFVPKIEFFVDDDFSYSLFGSKFYYSQNSKAEAGKVNNIKIEVGQACRALLFLHCFPFQGVNKKGISPTAINASVTAPSSHDIWDRFMFDFNSNGISETMQSGNVNPASEILGIKGLFRLHNGLVEAPQIWTLFIGAMLWRMQYSVNNRMQNGEAIDPIQFWKPNKSQTADRDTNRSNALIPNMSLAPRPDQFLSITLEDDYRVCGMSFYSFPKIEYPLKINSTENWGMYSKLDETLIGLPSQAKAEFINEFLAWVNTSFAEIQKDLEIDFNEGTVNTNSYLDKSGDNNSYVKKWERLNSTYTTYGGNNTLDEYDSRPLALDIANIKTILGDNIYKNYIMVAPISQKKSNGSIIQNFYKWPTTNTYEEYSEYYINKYIEGEHAYNMELNPNGQGMSKISSLLLSKVYIQNVRPEIWNPPNLEETGTNKGKRRYCFRAFTVKKSTLDEFIQTFHSHFLTISADLDKSADAELDKIQLELFKSMDDDKIKLNIYRTLMAIYQKWISNIKGEMFSQCSVNQTDKDIALLERNVDQNNPNARLIDSFRFLDRSFNDIGDIFYINPQVFQNMILDNRNASFFDIANKILSDNNFNFIPLPTFVNFNDINVLSDVFDPYPYNDVVLTGPSFVCVYAGQSSTNLDLGKDSIYEDDGIFIRTDANGNILDASVPADMISAKPPTAYETKMPIFTVNYGQQNQNYFKDIRLDQSEFSETAESLEIMDDIAQLGDKRKSIMVGQNLFNTYQKRSYSCEVEMLGCALIQPMMYFQLNNIPMFRGLYLIINVSHSIKPNGMTTTFKGVRVKKTKTPLLTASDVLITLIGDVSNVNNGGTTANAPAGSGNYRAVVANDAPFLARVKEVANTINADYTHLLGIMEIESGFDPSTCNAGNYCGLIQFSEENRRIYSTGNTDAQRKTNLISMTRTKQMDLVEKYFLNGRNGTGPIKPSELYLMVFLPAFVSKPDDYVIATAISDPKEYWKKNATLRDNSRPNKDIWKGYLGQLVEARAVKYQGL